jgi:hypothetical protein
VVVTKSTVPVGTGDEIERILRDVRPEGDMHVVSNPEFLREGAAIYDFKHPDRIVIGSDNEAARAVMAEVYRPLYLNAAPMLYVGRRTAELIKYAANAFLATKITFINEIADLCERTGADVQDVARGPANGRTACGKPTAPRPQSRGERRASRRQSPRPRGLKRDSWKLNHKRVVRHPKVRAKRASKAAWPRPSPFEGRFAATSG